MNVNQKKNRRDVMKKSANRCRSTHTHTHTHTDTLKTVNNKGHPI
jgi:hypothetical protein